MCERRRPVSRWGCSSGELASPSLSVLAGELEHRAPPVAMTVSPQLVPRLHSCFRAASKVRVAAVDACDNDARELIPVSTFEVVSVTERPQARRYRNLFHVVLVGRVRGDRQNSDGAVGHVPDRRPRSCYIPVDERPPIGTDNQVPCGGIVVTHDQTMRVGEARRVNCHLREAPRRPWPRIEVRDRVMKRSQQRSHAKHVFDLPQEAEVWVRPCNLAVDVLEDFAAFVVDPVYTWRAIKAPLFEMPKQPVHCRRPRAGWPPDRALHTHDTT